MWLNTRTHNFGGNMMLASKTAPSEPLLLMLTPLCALFSQCQYWPTDQSDQQNAGKGMMCGSQVLITEKLLLTPWMASPGKPRSPMVRFPWWRTEASHQKPASTWQSYKWPHWSRSSSPHQDFRCMQPLLISWMQPHERPSAKTHPANLILDAQNYVRWYMFIVAFSY